MRRDGSPSGEVNEPRESPGHGSGSTVRSQPDNGGRRNGPRTGERFKALVENSLDIIAVLRGDGRVDYVSPVIQSVLGYDPDELIGQPYTDFLHPEDIKMAVESFGGILLQRGASAMMDGRIKAKDGTWRLVEGQAHNLLHDPSVQGIILTSRDITDRRQTEESLRESEERYRSFVEAASDIIYAVSLEGIITSLNPAFESITGLPREEWLGRHFSRLIHPEDLPLAAEIFARAVSGERDEDPREYRILTSGGEYVTTEFLSRPQVQDGVVVGNFGIGRDVTVRKAAEEAKQSLREDIEARAEEHLGAANTYRLTFREMTVLHLVAQGKSDRDISDLLAIGVRTAQTHLSSILIKMRAASRTEAGVRAIREGLVE